MVGYRSSTKEVGLLRHQFCLRAAMPAMYERKMYVEGWLIDDVVDIRGWSRVERFYVGCGERVRRGNGDPEPLCHGRQQACSYIRLT